MLYLSDLHYIKFSASSISILFLYFKMLNVEEFEVNEPVQMSPGMELFQEATRNLQSFFHRFHIEKAIHSNFALKLAKQGDKQ